VVIVLIVLAPLVGLKGTGVGLAWADAVASGARKAPKALADAPAMHGASVPATG